MDRQVSRRPASSSSSSAQPRRVVATTSVAPHRAAASSGRPQPQFADFPEETADFPEEIIRLILLRLPVKSMVKFRCVSKSWLSLISSPQFIKSHLELSSENADFTNQRIILNFSEKPSKFKHCSVSSLMFETIVMSTVDYSKLYHKYAVIVGSCNGIICISFDSHVIVLSNLSTRKSKVLPIIHAQNRLCLFRTLGFGYSESEDDYKVIFMCPVGKETVVDIYSLRSGSWKRIEDFRFGMPICIQGKFASGKLHFTAVSMENEARGKYEDADIVSFDLKSEAFAILKKPNHEHGCYSIDLGLLGGCLSFLYQYERIRADVWVLKEYGVNESWTKVVSVPYFNGPHHCRHSFYIPLIMMPNDEIVLGCGSSVVVYNLRDNCLQYLQIGNSPRENCLQYLQRSNPTSFCVYFESLVPL